MLDYALDALIEARMKRKFAKTSRPRREASASRPSASKPSRSKPNAMQAPATEPPDSRRRPRSRHIPNAIKRAVVERDGMRCSFVDGRGTRCTATSRLEFHHHDPFAKGGAHNLSNVSLLCRAHNRHAAHRDYGVMMERYQRPPDRVREPRSHYRVSPERLDPGRDCEAATVRASVGEADNQVSRSRRGCLATRASSRGSYGAMSFGGERNHAQYLVTCGVYFSWRPTTCARFRKTTATTKFTDQTVSGFRRQSIEN